MCDMLWALKSVWFVGLLEVFIVPDEVERAILGFLFCCRAPVMFWRLKDLLTFYFKFKFVVTVPSPSPDRRIKSNSGEYFTCWTLGCKFSVWFLRLALSRTRLLTRAAKGFMCRSHSKSGDSIGESDNESKDYIPLVGCTCLNTLQTNLQPAGTLESCPAQHNWP